MLRRVNGSIVCVRENKVFQLLTSLMEDAESSENSNRIFNFFTMSHDPRVLFKIYFP